MKRQCLQKKKKGMRRSGYHLGLTPQNSSFINRGMRGESKGRGPKPPRYTENRGRQAGMEGGREEGPKRKNLQAYLQSQTYSRIFKLSISM